MHEYSIAEALVERVEAEARERRATAVRRVLVRVGELSGVEACLLATAFEILRNGTLCADASLVVEASPARWECAGCGARHALGSPLRCPACAVPMQLVEGGELLLERIDMEVP